MDDFDIQTILAVIVLAIVTVAAFPGFASPIIDLVTYLPVLLFILGYFGIQTLRSIGLTGTKIRELLPGILTNQEIVGIAGVISITWLYMNFIMTYEQWWALLRMILAALGIPLFVGYLRSYLTK